MALIAQKIVNLLSRIDGIELSPAGSGHGQGWRIIQTGRTGTIPLNTHGQGNLRAAIGELKTALGEAGIEATRVLERLEDLIS